MKWFIQTLNEAGFSRSRPMSALLILTLAGVIVGILIYEVTAIFALAASVAVGSIGLLLEALNVRAISRRAAVEALWPEVLDSIISAISSGSSLTESLLELADHGPISLRLHFQVLRQNVEGGKTLVVALESLKRALGSAHSDRLIELLVLVSEAGGAGLIESLRNQVKLARADLSFSGELTSRLGWITGTAKIAVGAPWVVVALLATRPENARAYASAEGAIVLFFGLALSIFAFRLVKTLGVLPRNPRVFA